MGGSVSFEANADSPSVPGTKSILTSEIEGAAPDQILDALEQYVRDGKATAPWASDTKVSEKDGGILVQSEFQNGMKSFNLYKIDRASKQVEILSFPGQRFLDKGVNLSTGMIKVLSEPVRVECWLTNHAVRLSGAMLKQGLDGVLTGLDASVETSFDAPGIEDPSKLSVVSAPIEGKPVDADSFLEKFKQFLVDKIGATENSDGSLVEERAGWFGLGGTHYVKYKLSKDGNQVYACEYESDATMTDLAAIVHVKVHKDPFRLEMWKDQEPVRRAGDDQLKLFQPVVEGALKAISG